MGRTGCRPSVVVDCLDVAETQLRSCRTLYPLCFGSSLTVLSKRLLPHWGNRRKVNYPRVTTFKGTSGIPISRTRGAQRLK